MAFLAIKEECRDYLGIGSKRVPPRKEGQI